MIIAPKRAVVFDANVYRGLSLAAARSLRAREQRCGIIGMASAFTVMELASHLADPADPARNDCVRALTALWEHCRWDDSDDSLLPFAADSEAQIALTLFGASLPGRQETAERMGVLVRLLAREGLDVVASRMQSTLEELRDHRDRVESQFADDMREVVGTLDPAAAGFQPWPADPDRRKRMLELLRRGTALETLAGTVVKKAAEHSGATVAATDLTRHAAFLVRQCATPLHFYQQQIQKLIESGVDFSRTKHANSIWDMQMCFYVAHGGTVAVLGLPLTLVSNERAIKTAAVSAGAPGGVMTIDEYSRFLDGCGASAP